MERIDRTALRIISERIMKAIGPLEEELGVKFSRGAGKFGDTYGSIKIEIATIDKNGKAQDHRQSDFKTYAHLFGFKASDFGRKFKSRGETFTICGLRPKAFVRPVIATSSTGRNFIFRAETVLAALKGGM
jgi:hypothetical protein